MFRRYAAGGDFGAGSLGRPAWAMGMDAMAANKHRQFAIWSRIVGTALIASALASCPPSRAQPPPAGTPAAGAPPSEANPTYGPASAPRSRPLPPHETDRQA